MIKRYKINRKNINKYKQYKIIKMKRQVIFPLLSVICIVMKKHIDEKKKKKKFDRFEINFSESELVHFLCTNSCVVHFLCTIVTLL